MEEVLWVDGGGASEHGEGEGPPLHQPPVRGPLPRHPSPQQHPRQPQPRMSLPFSLSPHISSLEEEGKKKEEGMKIIMLN